MFEPLAMARRRVSVYEERTIRLMKRYRQLTGATYKRISERMGIPYGTVASILGGKRWKGVK